MSLQKPLAEFMKTFWLVFGGCGSAALVAAFPEVGIGLLGVIGIPVTNVSVNPARSTGPALLVGDWAIQQLWLFWLAPVVGAVAAGLAPKAVAAGRT